MKQVQTDNSELEKKVELRLKALPDKNQVLVLECYAGDGVIWEKVKQQTEKEIKILRIDQKPDKKGVYLKGDNLKFIKSIDLSVFDIIDLDAYGSPFNLLEVVFQQNYKGIVHVTFIQTMQGALHKKMLNKLGFTNKMIEKCQTLFNQDGIGKLLSYLSLNGINQVYGYFLQNRKNYFFFDIK